MDSIYDLTQSSIVKEFSQPKRLGLMASCCCNAFDLFLKAIAGRCIMILKNSEL